MPVGLRVANFVDSSLLALQRKGNLSQALRAYNPLGIAETVLHFTVYPEDIRLSAVFAKRQVEIVPFFDRAQPGWRRVLASPFALLRVARRMRQARVSVVRGRLPYFSSFIGCLAARLLRIPCVVSLGGDNRIPQAREGRYYFGSRMVSYGLECCVLALANRIVVPNEFTRRYVARVMGARAAREKTVLIPWIIDAVTVLPATDRDLTSLNIVVDRPFALVVGHLNAYKFSREMLAMAALLQATRPEAVQVVFCGDGPFRAEAEAAAAVTPSIRLLGWQPNATVRALMLRAAVVLVPLSGFVLLEAAALGRPVIAGDIEWHNELIEDGETGWLEPPGDASRWRDRVLAVVDHPDAAAAVGAKLRAKFEAGYSPERGLRLEAQLYQEMARCRTS